jgi:hypothetical protein
VQIHFDRNFDGRFCASLTDLNMEIFQFSIERTRMTSSIGVFSVIDRFPSIPIPAQEKELTDEELEQLLYLAHTDEKRRSARYTILSSTNGQICWSDLASTSIYPDNYTRN